MTKQLLIGLAATCLVLGACSDDDDNKVGCTTAADCADGEICDYTGTCKAVITPACVPACGGTAPICDEASGTCKTCTETEGCSGARSICDTTAKDGVGACIACYGNDDCTSPAFCDTETNSCVGCTDEVGCASGQICDTTAKSGVGACVTCTRSAGCGDNQVCDTSVTGGKCVTCLVSAECGAGLVCDTSVSGGACVTCTATAGCAAGLVCDTSVTGGECVGCKSDTDCEGALICDNQQCVTCNDANKGCEDPTPLCNVSANSGKGVCVACIGDGDCEGEDAPYCASGACVACTTNAHCEEANQDAPYCASGACVVCTTNAHCEAVDPDAPYCTNGACAICNATAGCEDDLVCDNSVEGGACVVCITNADCTDSETPVCDTDTNECVTGCLSATDCTEDAPFCVEGICMVCTADAGCEDDKVCDTNAEGGACVECVEDNDCGTGETCSDNVCLSVSNVAVQIDAVRSAAAVSDLDLPVTGAVVTYLRPDTGSTQDKAGFFVQAGPTGPAMLVEIDPTSLVPAPKVGDTVSFQVTEKTVRGQATEVAAVTDWAVTGSGFDVTTWIQDLSEATDVVADLVSYEAELITITGTITDAFSPSGDGHVFAHITTDGISEPGNLELRLAASLNDEAKLSEGCVFTLVAGPMWRYNARAQASAYYASDLSQITCPGPKLVSATATDANTVVVTFDRLLDEGSVLADGSQFTFNGLTASAATAAGQKVTVTTDAQVPETSYTVTVANTVKSARGDALEAPFTADFTGYSSLACAPAIVISQVYGGGGNSGATYTHDFIELHNRSPEAVSVNGWSLQYTSATGPSSGNSWAVSPLLDATIPAGGYFLVRQSGGSNGTGLPDPDDIAGTLAMGASAGKVALVSSKTALTDACPTGVDVVDLAFYGTTSTATCGGFLGTTSNLSVTTSALRDENGCTDTDNATDFTIGPIAPRNSGSPAVTCGCL